MDKPNLYAVLGVRKNAGANTIKKAYRRLAMQYHPDRNPGDGQEEAAARYRAVTEAYEILSDPARRKRYDETGDTSAARGETKELLDFLVPRLMQTVREQVNAKCHKRVNLITSLVSKIRGDMGTVEQSAKNLEWTVKELREVASRLGVKEGENLFASIITTQASRAEMEAQAARAEVAKCQKALDYLSGCTYRTDGSPDSEFGESLKKMLGTTSSSWYKIGTV